MKPLDWPDDRCKFWWMQWKPKTQDVACVTTVRVANDDYLEVLGYIGFCSKNFLASRGARFLPCEPPTFED